MTFTDYYGQQSCTAGRAAFITGQNPIRTGLTKVGMPGADVGLRAEDPTIAELLKPLGYATGSSVKIIWAKGRNSSRRCTVSTSSSAILSLERRGRAGRSRLSERRRIQEALWTARRSALLVGRQGRSKDRRHRSADEKAYGNDRRGSDRARAELHRQSTQGGTSRSSLYNTTAMHFRTHGAAKHNGKSGRAIQRRDGRA